MTPGDFSTEQQQALARVRECCVRIGARTGETIEQLSINYVSGYRRTLVYQVTMKTNKADLELFVKVGRNLSQSVLDFVAKEARLSTEIRRLFPATASLDVIEPIAFFPDLAVFATRTIAGQRLDHIIVAALRSRSKRKLEYAIGLVERCGEWLQVFQKTLPRGGEVDEVDFLSGIRRQVERIARSRPELFPARTADTVLGTAERLHGGLLAVDRRRVTRHDDFAPWNVMVDAERVVVFDFPNVQDGSYFYDMYHFDFAMQTLSKKFLVSIDRLDILRRHFRMAFDKRADESPIRRRFFSIQFCLVKLGSLIHLHRPTFPKSIVIDNRVRLEVKKLESLCGAD